jgi:hypothetical protein
MLVFVFVVITAAANGLQQILDGGICVKLAHESCVILHLVETSNRCLQCVYSCCYFNLHLRLGALTDA